MVMLTRDPSRNLLPFGALLAVFVILAVGGLAYVISLCRMPGESFVGTLPPLSVEQYQVKERLRSHVDFLCNVAGRRDYTNPAGLEKSADMIFSEFSRLGYSVRKERVPSPDLLSGTPAGEMEFWNIVAEKSGTTRPEEVLVIGAHYDTCAGTGTVGADDNASGVAGLLELARLFSSFQTARTVRFVALVNEEPPFFKTDYMGSRVHARQSVERGDKIVGMLCLEMIGYYSSEPKSQKYPFPLEKVLSKVYPSTGNFVAFVSDISSRQLLSRSLLAFRENAQFPSEGVFLPGWVQGIDWSDHASFWKHGIPAVMITDTAIYRNHFYHTPMDTPDSLDYESMARVVDGLQKVCLLLLAPE